MHRHFVFQSDFALVLLSLGCVVIIYLVQEHARVNDPLRLELDLGEESALGRQKCMLVTAYEFVKQHPTYFGGGTCVRNWEQRSFGQHTFPRFPIRPCPWQVGLFSFVSERAPTTADSFDALPPPRTSILWRIPELDACRFDTTKYFKMILKST